MTEQGLEGVMTRVLLVVVFRMCLVREKGLRAGCFDFWRVLHVRWEGNERLRLIECLICANGCLSGMLLGTYAILLFLME